MTVTQWHRNQIIRGPLFRAQVRGLITLPICPINRKKYKTVFAELSFTEDTFDRLAMILYGICNVSFICHAIFKERMIKCGIPTSLYWVDTCKLLLT